jgi:hypothetical protein
MQPWFEVICLLLPQICKFDCLLLALGHAVMGSAVFLSAQPTEEMLSPDDV